MGFAVGKLLFLLVESSTMCILEVVHFLLLESSTVCILEVVHLSAEQECGSFTDG